MVKVRDINGQPSKSCWETVYNWAAWKKILVGVVIALALTLIITLPIVLTGNETSTIPDGNITATTSSATQLLTTSTSAQSTTATRAESTTTTDMNTSIKTTTSSFTVDTTNEPTSITTTTDTTRTSTRDTSTTGKDTTVTSTTGKDTTITSTTDISIITSTITISTPNSTATTSITTATGTLPTTSPARPPTPPPGISGWGEWFEWSGCTVTCGKGQRSKIRLCSDGTGGIGDERDCPGDSHRIEVCTNEKCLTGQKLTTGMSQDLRKNILLRDNLFLDRYAQSVTLYGEIINADGASVPGYGIWRLTRADYEKVLNAKRRRLTKNEKSSEINSDFFQNVLLGCGKIDGLNESTSIDDILDMTNIEPCSSAMALVTLLYIEGNYPVPIDFDAQESILYGISDQISMSWEETLYNEKLRIIAKCENTDIDFDFVFDASGSVGTTHWQLSMDQTAEFWIRQAIRPNGAEQCGNHVAARRYSSNGDSYQVRWHDFAPPHPSIYDKFSNYTEYVASVFENEPFSGGGTYTAEALRRVRVEDIPTAKPGQKHVIILTDGASSDAANLQSESTQLQNAVDKVYAFGIGSGPNESELELIASNSTRGFGWDLMDDFSKYEFIIRNFILIQGGCDTDLVKPFRIDEK